MLKEVYKNINIGAYASALDDAGNIWVSDVLHNGLFKYNIEEHSMEYIGRFPDLDILSADNHLDAQFFDNEIVFIPICDEFVYTYGVGTSLFNKIGIPLHKRDTRYVSSIIVNKCLYFASQEGNIFSINIEDKIINFELNLFNEFGLARESDYKQAHYVASYKNGFVVCLIDDKELLVIDILNNENKRFGINKLKSPIYKISSVNNNIYVLYRDDIDILECDLTNGKQTVYTNKSIDWLGETKIIPYEDIVEVNNNLLVLNMYSKNIYTLDVQKKAIRTFNELSSLEKLLRLERTYGPLFNTIIKYKKQYFFIPCRSRKMIVYDENSHIYKYENFSIDKTIYNYSEEYIKGFYKMYKVIFEGCNACGLKDFVKYVADV